MTYRPIPSRPEYYAGSDGSIWSHKQNPPIRRKPGLTSAGRNRAYICFRPGDMVQVPHLVLEAFIGPRPEGEECCHNNGNALDNRLSNLRWGSPSSNAEDKVKHGTASVGERHGRATLTESAVRKILAWEGEGISAAEMGRRLQVKPRVVLDVIRGRTWMHFTGRGKS